MPPRTRASRRDNKNIKPVAPEPEYNDDDDDSSSDESIPPARLSAYGSELNDVATLRPGHFTSPPASHDVPQGRKGRISNKRAADGSLATAERQTKKQRRYQPETAHMSRGSGDDTRRDADADVNHAALDAINAFNRRRRGAEPSQRRGIEIQIPSSRNKAGLESDWNPDEQLQKETAAYRELHMASGPAESRKSAYSVELSDAGSERNLDIPPIESMDLEEPSSQADPGSEAEIADGGGMGSLDLEPDAWEGRDEQGGESDIEGYREPLMPQDNGSPELNSHLPYRSVQPTESLQEDPSPTRLRAGEEMGYASKIGYENTSLTAGPAKAPKKSKARVAEPVYSERAVPEQQNGSISNTQTRAPRARPSALVQHRPSPTLELFQGQTPVMSRPQPGRSGNGQSPSNLRVAGLSRILFPRHAPQVGPDENGPAPDDEFFGLAPSDDFLSTQGPAAPESQLVVTLKSKPVHSMRRLLGRSGWTALGWDWIFELSDPKLYGKPSASKPHNAPPRTKLGRGCWKFLVYLQSLFGDAPKAPDFAAQSKWLDDNRSRIDKTYQSIDTMIRKVSEDYLAAVGDSEKLANDNMELRLALVKDLVEYIIPMLVSALHTISLLGGGNLEEDGRPELLEEGAFTIATLDYLMEVVGWIVSLERTLTDELQRRPLDASSGAESSDGGGGRHRKAKDGRQKAKAIRRNKRLQLGKYIGQFRHNIVAAYDKLDKEATRAERRRQAIAREKDLKEAMLKEEEAKEEETQRRWQAMCKSTQRMRHGPNPLSEKWRKAQALWAEPAVGPSTSRRAVAVPQQPVPAITGGRPAARQLGRVGQGPAKPPARWPPWSEADSLWVLTQLRLGPPELDVRRLADSLERDVEDVRQEVRVLKQSWISLALERGVEVEGWARG